MGDRSLAQRCVDMAQVTPCSYPTDGGNVSGLTRSIPVEHERWYMSVK